MARTSARGPAGRARPAVPAVLAAVAAAAAVVSVPAGAGGGPASGAPSGQDAAGAPYPIYTARHLAEAMATLGPNVDAARAAIDAGDAAAAKARLARAREQLAPTITFWRRRGLDDAVRFVRDAAARMDALDAVLSADRVDARAAAARADALRAACDACHAVYREPDPAGGFRLGRSVRDPDTD